MQDVQSAHIKKTFGKISPYYDFLNHLLSFNIDNKWRKIASEYCPSNGLILDICSGTGDFAIAIYKRCGGKVFGIDFSDSMLKFAQLKTRRANLNSHIKFSIADLLMLPFRDCSFDAVTVAFGIRNTVNIDNCIREMTRVTKKEGKIVILEFAIPQVKIVKSIYLFYLKRILPIIGDFISHSKENAYRYLANSISKFPVPNELVKMLGRNNIKKVYYIPLTYGIVALYIGGKY